MLTKIKNGLTLRLFPFILYFMAARKENADEVCFDLSQAAKRIANIRFDPRQQRSRLRISALIPTEIRKKVFIYGNKRNSDIIGKLG